MKNNRDTKPDRPDPISMRLPEPLKSALAEAARAGGRSLNAEIRMRLEWSLEHACALGAAHETKSEFIERLTELEAVVGRELKTVQAQIRRVEDELSELQKA